jgi:hypothetical protein
LQRSNWRPKAKRATSFRDAARHVWKKRSFPFKRKRQRGDMPSFGTQPLSGATMQHPRDSKIMTSKRRKLPNRRSCFLFRIEGYGSCRHPRGGYAETLLLRSFRPDALLSKGRRLPRNRTFCDLLPRTLQATDHDQPLRGRRQRIQCLEIDSRQKSLRVELESRQEYSAAPLR